MQFNVEIEYSLVLLRGLSRSAQQKPISAQQISQAEAYPLPYTRKILKRLTKGGIIRSVQGQKGGYVLVRSPSQISVKDIIEAVEREVFRVYCEPPHIERIICTHFHECSLRPIWNELEKAIGAFLQQVTLQTLMDSEDKVREGLQHETSDLVVLDSNKCRGSDLARQHQ